VDHLTRMISELERLGDISKWRVPLREVPRHLFVPDRAWCTPDDAPGFLIDRRRDPDGWMESAYADMSIVTQLDDGRGDLAQGSGEYTSSLSAPSVVIAGLSLLNPQPGERVLEVGTGTGWTAALLCHVVGAENVTTVEVDSEVLARARENLKAAGYVPRLIWDDGAKGWPQGAPYDRIHVTCGIADVPYEWVSQTRPGGVIVCPWMVARNSGQLASLTVNDDGTAVGYFYGEVNYMMLRAQRRTVGDSAGPIGAGITVTPHGQKIWQG
jgi:protein-L-isoaspartate O-methyltransferase